MLVGSISCMFKERFEFDIEEFFNFPEIKKYMEMEYIEIKDEHLREFLKLEYFHKCENLDQYLTIGSKPLTSFIQNTNLVAIFAKRTKYTKITLDDFQKIKVIGQGGFA